MVTEAEGTAVYGADGTKIGSIERVMIDKLSGKVSYAVLSFGGLLGIGDDHYPLPWQSLKYDTDLGGYVTGITEAQLQDAPRYSNHNHGIGVIQPERVRRTTTTGVEFKQIGRRAASTTLFSAPLRLCNGHRKPART